MSQVRKLSCKRCQSRKIKCSRTQPCSNCAQINHECDYRRNDARRHPVSHGYVNSLETRILWLESFLRKLKSVSSEARDAMLRDLSMDTEQSNLSEEPSLSRNVGLLKSGSTGSLHYHGVTSIYADSQSNGASQALLSTSSSMHNDDMVKVRLAAALGIDSNLIKTCLPLFFLYQYPQLMFVYREAFLADYFDNTYNGKYWSYALVYAISALGALHSSEENIRNKAGLMAKCAKEIILTYELASPASVTIQALLCLAFYEISQGNTSQGWLFAGMAFRTGQDIGFHRDPINWLSQDQSIITAEDIEIRRRLYWGCYVVDKFMSLYLGRPVSLSARDGSVQPSKSLPDFSFDHDWFGLLELAKPHSNLPPLVNTHMHTVKLGIIFESIISSTLSTRSENSISTSIHQLSEINLRLNQWLHDLPEYLQWSRWSIQETQQQHHVIILHLFYHSICLSFNRQFLEDPSGAARESSHGACESSCSSVIAIIRQFKHKHDMRKSPLILIYALVTTSVTLTKLSLKPPPISEISFLLGALNECSCVYRVAAEAHSDLSDSLLKKNYNVPPLNRAHRPGPEAARESLRSPVGASENFEHVGNQPNLFSDMPLQVPLEQLLDSSIEHGPQTSMAEDSFYDVVNWNNISLDSFQMEGDFRGWFSMGSGL